MHFYPKSRYGIMVNMSVRGTIREWHQDEGWGVIDSPETPGGCWMHFGVVQVEGYPALFVGQDVRLEWEAPGQDGYHFRAVRVDLL